MSHVRRGMFHSLVWLVLLNVFFGRTSHSRYDGSDLAVVLKGCGRKDLSAVALLLRHRLHCESFYQNPPAVF